MSILDDIINHKKTEIALAKKRLPLTLLKKKLSATTPPTCRIKKTARLQLIAEIKFKSPTAGTIRAKTNIGKLAGQLQKNGASAISVLTDRNYFGGCLDDLAAVKKSAGLPVLRKDFIIDEYQLYESKFYGADVILLIASALKRNIKKFAALALRLGLQPFIEVHGKSELNGVLKSVKPSAKIIIGINNRDLRTFGVNLATSLNLAGAIPKKFIRISESGIVDANQLAKLKNAGFDGALIGTALVKNPILFDHFKR